MSLSLRKGNVIAMINCKNNKKYDKKLIRIDTNPDLDDENGLNELNFSKECSVQILPSVDHVERLYLAGSSGSGKSYFVSKWLSMNRKIFRGKQKKDIYIFSRIQFDQQLDKFNPIRPELESLVEEPITGEELENSIVIFDDIDSISDRVVKQCVYDLQTDLLTTGRHFNITVICTNHMIYNGLETKRTINESTGVVIFPRSGQIYQQKNFLKNYMGFEKNMITKVMKLPSRWIYLRKRYPQCVIYNRGAFIPQLED